jgi:hypothetical protein
MNGVNLEASQRLPVDADWNMTALLSEALLWT